MANNDPSAADPSDNIPSSPLPGLGAPVKQPPSIPSGQLETLTVPDGTPEELLGFINKLVDRLNRLQSDVLSGKGSPVMLQPTLVAMVTACDKILASNTSPEIRKQGIEYKALALSSLRQIAPDEPWNDKIRAFAQELVADKDPTVALNGKVMQFGILIGDVMTSKTPDANVLINEMKSLLADEARDESVLRICLQLIYTLRELGQDDQAKEAFSQIADAFISHPDEQLRGEADNMKEQLLIWDLKLDARLSDLVRGKTPEANQTFTEAVTQLIQQPKLNRVALETLVKILPVLEQFGLYTEAQSLCQLAQASFQQNGVPEVQPLAKQKLEPIAIRLGLIGKPLAISGTQLNGAPFDFAPYQGKTVLVVFWWTRSPECQPELERVKAAYDKYHAKGFEVIGVSLDQDPAAVSSYIDQLKLPWVTITNMGLVDQFGIEVVPYLLLTDAQGNVTRLFLRGTDLESILAASLGEPAPTAPTGAPARPPNG
jgi:tetratricopeptide (TPR) repeat protein